MVLLQTLLVASVVLLVASKRTLNTIVFFITSGLLLSAIFFSWELFYLSIFQAAATTAFSLSFFAIYAGVGDEEG